MHRSLVLVLVAVLSVPFMPDLFSLFFGQKLGERMGARDGVNDNGNGFSEAQGLIVAQFLQSWLVDRGERP